MKAKTFVVTVFHAVSSGKAVSIICVTNSLGQAVSAARDVPDLGYEFSRIEEGVSIEFFDRGRKYAAAEHARIRKEDNLPPTVLVFLPHYQRSGTLDFSPLVGIRQKAKRLGLIK